MRAPGVEIDEVYGGVVQRVVAGQAVDGDAGDP